LSAPAPRIRPPMKFGVVRSPRRRKRISAEHREGRVVVRLPAGLSRTEERQWVHRMVTRLTEREQAERLSARRGLQATADRLNREHFGGRLRWSSIRFVSNQRDRYGSCPPPGGSIRISPPGAGQPAWVRGDVGLDAAAPLQ